MAAAAEVTWELCKPGARVWIAAPSYELTRRVFEYVYRWVAVDKVLDQITGRKMVKAYSYSEKAASYIRLTNGGFVHCRSGESDANIGDQIDLLVVDEAARMHPMVWEQDLKPTLVDRQGRALFISTPRGRNWFYDLFRRKDQQSTYEKGWRGSRFATWDNPFIDPAWVRSEEAETTPDVFRREYGASFEHFEGLVYPQFKDYYHDFDSPGQGGHLFTSDIELPLRRMTLYRAGDTGVEHPTAWYVAAVGAVQHRKFIGRDDDVWIFLGYHGAPNTPHPEHAKELKRISAGLQIYDSFISPDAWRRHRVMDDPVDDKSIADVYEEHGIQVRKANNDLKLGIDTVRAYLIAALQDTPTHGRVFIHERLTHLRTGLLNYVWDLPHHRMGRQRDSPEKPRKYKDDDVDALRYLLASGADFIPLDMRPGGHDLGLDGPRYGYPRERSAPQRGRIGIMGDII